MSKKKPTSKKAQTDSKQPHPPEESLFDLLMAASAGSRPEPGTKPLTRAQRRRLVAGFLGHWSGAPTAPDPTPATPKKKPPRKKKD
jgi:hypothetical protein